MRPSQKYGITVMITNIGGMRLSSRPPRRQAPTIPIPVPRMNASTVVTPTRPRVHGIASSTMCPTEFPGWVVSDSPKLPVATSPRYLKYCATRFWWVLSPNCASSALSACGLITPLWLAIAARAGFPGIMRGSRKLSVRATHRVSRKKPRRRSTNLMPSSCRPWGRPPNARAPGAAAQGAAGRPGPGLGGIPPGGMPPRPVAGLLRRQVEHQDAPVRVVVGGGLGVRVALGDPAGEAARVVLVPVDRLGDRDHRDVRQHHLLQLVHDRALGGRAGGGAVLVDQRVRGRVAVPLEVGSGGGPDRRRVGREQQLAQLEVRRRAAGLGAVAELVLAGVEILLVGG